MKPALSLLSVVLALLGAAACYRSSTSTSQPDAERGRLAALDVGRRATPELLRYYGAGLLHTPSDPFKAGLIIEREGIFYLNVDTLAAIDGWAASRFTTATGGLDEIGWDSLAAFLESTHERLRHQPSTVEALMHDIGFDESDEWVTVDVTGVMSTMRRRVSVARKNIVSALRNFEDNGGRIIYPIGTAFLARHYERDSLKETTAMRKRADADWDFFVYGPDGMPARTTAPRPRPLKVPTQCVGCHFGSKLYEPEKSFPAPAPDGPHGPRALHVAPSEADPEVVRFFDEHRKRSDHVLGLYATTFVSELRHQRSVGALDADSKALLEELGL